MDLIHLEELNCFILITAISQVFIPPSPSCADVDQIYFLRGLFCLCYWTNHLTCIPEEIFMSAARLLKLRSKLPGGSSRPSHLGLVLRDRYLRFPLISACVAHGLFTDVGLTCSQSIIQTANFSPADAFWIIIIYCKTKLMLKDEIWKFWFVKLHEPRCDTWHWKTNCEINLFEAIKTQRNEIKIWFDLFNTWTVIDWKQLLINLISELEFCSKSRSFWKSCSQSGMWSTSEISQERVQITKYFQNQDRV